MTWFLTEPNLIYSPNAPNATIDVHADYRLDMSNPAENLFRVFDVTRAPIATGGRPGGIAMQRGAVPKITVNPGCDTSGQPGDITLRISSRLDVASDTIWRDESEFDFTLETVGKAGVTLFIDGAPFTEPISLFNETTGADPAAGQRAGQCETRVR